MSDTRLKDQFLEGMSRAPASVSIVTTDGPAGKAGLTVSAWVPVSADGPAPSMLVCLNETSSAVAPLLENGCFCINVLCTEQLDLSDVFSGRKPAPGDDRFAVGSYVPGATGAPRLEGAVVSFDCELISEDKIGTHHVCIGAVREVHVGDKEEPLLYGMRSYLRAEKH